MIRLSRIVVVCSAVAGRLLLRRLGTLIGRPAGDPGGGELLARTAERLGPAFVKAAQILSTRADLLPPPTRAGLSRLYHRVRFPPATRAWGSVPSRLLAAVDGGADRLEPVAAGSIACVFRARLRTGEQVAVKVLRPGVTRTLATDLTLLTAGGRALTLLRRHRWRAVGQALGPLAEAIFGQVDLVREAEDLTRLRGSLAAELPAVRVPAVLPRWSDDQALVMEYVPALDEHPVHPGPETGRSSEPAVQEAAVVAMRACFHLLFLEGMVHCDMHPGNLVLRPDGGCVLLDAGFSHRLTPYARRRFAEFFHGMARGEGDRCADIVLDTATGEAADLAGFRQDLAELVRSHTNRSVADFRLERFATRLFDLQRRHGLVPDPEFVFPILSLLVLEGTLREVCPELDFQREALPYMLRGQMT